MNEPHYLSGEAIQVGDLIKYGDSNGKIVFVIPTQSFSEEFPESEWGFLEKGYGVKTEQYGLIHELEADEDLTLITRKK